jgi:hypothetical protein
MANCADNFDPSFLVVQQTKIYYVVRIDTGPQQPRNDINTYLRSLVEDLNVLWYNNGVEF